MSSNKHFLRVTNNWTKIAEPADNNNYFANISGTTIQCVLTDDEVSDPTTIDADELHPFTVGGTISQLGTQGVKWVYARADVGATGQAAIMVDTERMPVDDVNNIQEEVQSLAVEIMKLTKRVSTNRLDNIDHGIDYELFIRQFIDSTAEHHLQFTALHKHVATIWEELFLAEKYIQQHRSDYAVLKDLVDHIETRVPASGGGTINSAELQQLQDDVASVITTIGNCTRSLDDLKKQVQLNTADIGDITNSELPPIKSKVNELSDNLAALNNALVQMTVNYTVDDVNDTFSDLIVGVPASSIATVTAIRDFIISIINNKTALSSISSGDEILTTNDTLLLDGDDVDVIKAISL